MDNCLILQYVILIGNEGRKRLT